MGGADLGPIPGLGYAQPVRDHALVRLEGDASRDDTATVAEEVPVAFVYGGRSHAVVMATPADLEDLAVGFTVSERLVPTARDVGRVDVVRHSRGIEVQVEVPDDAAERLAARSRAMSARTGCGLCGIEAIDEVLSTPPRIDSAILLEPDALWRAAAQLDERQPWNRETHAIHAAAWSAPDGTLRVVREDVGRHNALDKVLGALLRAGTDPATGFLLVTSRASYELVLKAAVARVPLLAAVSRPTSLAIRLAEEVGLTLVALLRGNSANVYAHPHRVTTVPTSLSP